MTTRQSPPALPEPSYLCPLLQVYDMPTSLRFYRDLLGFQVVRQAPEGAGDCCDWAWLRAGDANLMLNTRYEADDRPPTPDSTRQAAHEDVGLFLGVDDVDAVFQILRARGLELDPPETRPYGMRQLSLKDPDGFALCFQCPAAD